MTAEELIRKLDGVRETSDGWTARCPAHEDTNPSLSISQGDDGRILLHCHAGCSPETVVFALGLSMADLFPDSVPKTATPPVAKPSGRIVAMYDYKDEEGRLLYQVVRFEPKDFRQRQPRPDGNWDWNVRDVRRVPYRLPELIAAVREGKIIFVVEGEKDADSLVDVGLIATTNAGGAGKWPTAFADHFRNAKITILPDNDLPGQKHAEQVARSLQGIAAEVRIVQLPNLPRKGDVSDWLATGGTKDELEELVEQTPPWQPSTPSTKRIGAQELEGASTQCRYQATPAGIIFLKQTKDGLTEVPITNFTARIITDIEEDDGVETRHLFEIEATVEGRTSRLRVPATQFGLMTWVPEKLGGGAIIHAGPVTRDHARAAIQFLSGRIRQVTVYTHSGWRQHDGEWVYLTESGGLGAAGLHPNIQVNLPDALRGYALPPPEEELVKAGVRASLSLLDVAPDELMIPLLAAAFRAVLEDVDFGIHVAGPTGTFKTAVTALIQQHFGPAMDARHLPGSWSSTANSLEGTAFAAKDTVLVVDDFAPGGTIHDAARLHREADRLFRAQGNRSGRGRMRPDGSLRSPKPPRGLILSTGEDVPRGESLRARLLVLEVSPGVVDVERLTQAQADGAAGLYAAAMAGFVRWVSGHYDAIRRGFPAQLAKLQDHANKNDLHRRTPVIVANLTIGWQCFLQFALTIGVIDKAQAIALWEQGWAALGTAAEAQSRHQLASEPTRRFLELVSAAITSGRAHVAGPGGHDPDRAEAWGWRETIAGTGDWERSVWHPRGDRIGWLDGENLYLDAEAALAAAQRMARDTGDAVNVSVTTLKRRLKEQDLLATVDQARETITIRRTLEGAQRHVLHLEAALLRPSPSNQPDKPDKTDTAQQLAAPAAKESTSPTTTRPVPPARRRPSLSGLSGWIKRGRP